MVPAEDLEERELEASPDGEGDAIVMEAVSVDESRKSRVNRVGVSSWSYGAGVAVARAELLWRIRATDGGIR